MSGVRLTQSDFAEALQTFARREGTEEAAPDTPKLLSNEPVQAVLTEGFLRAAGRSPFESAFSGIGSFEVVPEEGDFLVHAVSHNLVNQSGNTANVTIQVQQSSNARDSITSFNGKRMVAEQIVRMDGVDAKRVTHRGFIPVPDGLPLFVYQKAENDNLDNVSSGITVSGFEVIEVVNTTPVVDTFIREFPNV